MSWLLSESSSGEIVHEYFSILAIGSQHQKDDMLVRLRVKLEKLHEQKGNRKEPKTAAAIYYMITGWNYWVTQRTTNYQLPKGGLSDPYPVPIPVEGSR